MIKLGTTDITLPGIERVYLGSTVVYESLPPNLITGWVDGYYINQNGVPTAEAGTSHYTDAIPVEANHSYYIQITTKRATGTARLHFYSSTDISSWVSQLVNFKDTLNTYWYVEFIPSTSGYVRFSTGTMNEDVALYGSSLPIQLPISGWTDNYKLNNSGLVESNTSMRYSDAIAVLPNTTYFVTGKLSGQQNRRVCEYRTDVISSESFVKESYSNNINGGNASTRYAFTTDSNTNYIRISYTKNDTFIVVCKG